LQGSAVPNSPSFSVLSPQKTHGNTSELLSRVAPPPNIFAYKTKRPLQKHDSTHPFPSFIVTCEIKVLRKWFIFVLALHSFCEKKKLGYSTGIRSWPPKIIFFKIFFRGIWLPKAFLAPQNA
jgi:hypothetical protein